MNVKYAWDAKYWTIAYRKPRANRFKRVTDYAATWDDAAEMCCSLSLAHPELEVWVTTTAESERVGYTPEEDCRNILSNNGTRVLVVDTGSLAELGVTA